MPVYETIPDAGYLSLETANRFVILGGAQYLPANLAFISGAHSRDPGNTPVVVLRAGLLMGRRTSDGLWAPTVIGPLTVAGTSAGTTLTLSTAAATEVLRRIEVGGDLTVIGPPTAGGVVASLTATVDAVDTSTGVVTLDAALGADAIAGSFVCAADGSETPKSFITTGNGVRVVTQLTDESVDRPYSFLPVAGVVDFSQLIPSPTDASLIAWVRDNLSTAAGGKFIFNNVYQG